MNIISKASIFAKAAHAAVGQRRKYTNDPYFVHPKAVASLVSDHGGSDEMIAAAYLHDVLEDTQADQSLLESEFGITVAYLVYQLTDGVFEGNRMHRFLKDLHHKLEVMGKQAKLIKLADLIDNTSSIVTYDKEFATVYLAEKMWMMEVLFKDMDHSLYYMAFDTLNKGLCNLPEDYREKYHKHYAKIRRVAKESYPACT